MRFYEIKARSLPQLLFACEVTAENYANKFSGRRDFLEISVVRRGSIIYEPTTGEKEFFQKGELETVLPDFQGRTYSENGNCHLTAGVAMEYDWVLHDSRLMTDGQLQQILSKAGKEYVYLLPFRGAAVEQYPGAIQLLEQIAQNNLQGDASDKNLCISGFLHLLSCLSAGCILHLKNHREVSGFAAKQNLCESVKAYVNTHFRTKITLEDLSRETGFSPNYLCRVFKSMEKISVVDYITGFRMNLARDMIAEGGMTAREIAGAVGITDEYYLSKLFRKQFGMAIQTYRASLRNPDSPGAGTAADHGITHH